MTQLPVRAGAVLIGILVDRSGSMSRHQAEMEGGLNAFVVEQASLPGDAGVTLAQFDDNYEVMWPMQSLAGLEGQRYTLKPRGGTALYDAIGRFIGEINEQLSHENEWRPVICCICTDGMENGSKEWTKGQVREWINHQRTVYKWEFIFLGANLDAVLEGEKIGVPKDFALTFSTKQGKETFALLSKRVASLRAGSTAGFSDADRRKAIGQ